MHFILFDNRSKVLYDRPTEKFRPSSLKEQHQVISLLLYFVIDTLFTEIHNKLAIYALKMNQIYVENDMLK